MLPLITKLFFFFKQPILIVITEPQESLISEALFWILKPHSKTKKIENIGLKDILLNKALILSLDSSEDLAFFIESAKKSILVVNQLDEGMQTQTKKMGKSFAKKGALVLNFDDQTIREMEDKTSYSILTFGFLKGADLSIADLNITDEATNLKVEYKGNTVPIWLSGNYKKSEIYAILAGIGCALQLDLNLVEISQTLKTFKK